MTNVSHFCEPITVVSHNGWAINVATHDADAKSALSKLRNQVSKNVVTHNLGAIDIVSHNGTHTETS